MHQEQTGLTFLSLDLRFVVHVSMSLPSKTFLGFLFLYGPSKTCLLLDDSSFCDFIIKIHVSLSQFCFKLIEFLL